MELIAIQPTGKTPITESVQVYIITREGKSFNEEGLKFIQNGLKEHFGINTDLAIYTGIGLNSPKVLTKLLKNNPNAYIILSMKDQIGFFPQDINDKLCLNFKNHPNESSWEILMRSCEKEIN